MNFSQYVDFEDFCNKNNMTSVEGLRFLESELEKLRSES